MAVITGTAGNDTLTSTGFGDSLVGGAGDDLYIIDDAADVVVEQGDSGTLTRVSTSSTGQQADDQSYNAVFSPDGKKLLFISKATNLVSGDSNAAFDVFIKDLTTGAVTRLSTSASNVQGNGDSYNALFSPDGSKVLFESSSSNLVTGDSNGKSDIFVKNLSSGVVTLVSSTNLGVQGNADSFNAHYSADGTKVVFSSFATNLVAGDSNGAEDIFVKDLASGIVTLVSSSSTGVQANGDSDTAVFSPDGNKVAFESSASNLVAGDTNGITDIFIKNLSSGAVTRLSTSSDGSQANGDSYGQVFSADGSKMLFVSSASNLVAGDSNGVYDIFIKDLNTGVVTRVSTDSQGLEANGESTYAAFTPDGSKVIFQSLASNLVAGDSNARYDVFIKDLASGAVTRISTDSLGAEGNGHSFPGAVSPDGTKVVIESGASNLVSGDTNATDDIFIKTLPIPSSDTVQSSVSYTLGDWVENLILTGSNPLSGTGNVLDNVITGNSSGNTLSGLAGNDTLDGGGGFDTLIGGTGNDTYIINSNTVQITELAGEGIDTVQSSTTYTLGANLENLTLTGSFTIDGTGNALDNVLTGNSSTNTLSGLGGNDTYIINNFGDVVNEAANAGIDLVRASVNYTLSANVENLTLTGSTGLSGNGNELDNVITGTTGNDVLGGNAGNDTLDGGLGADTLAGSSGNDLYIVDNAADQVNEFANDGTDTVKTNLSYTLTVNVENLILTGSASSNGTGNALANQITGNTANNTLDGGAGIDTLIGGAGDDTYIVDNNADVITELAGEGTDLVYTSTSYTIANNVENVTVTGSGVAEILGNSLNNVITGNSGTNYLDGGAGSDTLIGGLGDDQYTLDSDGIDSLDTIVEAAGGGNDTVHVFMALNTTLSANVENLDLYGGGNINGTGNVLANVMQGGTGNNILDGAAGADTMAGGAGDDTYIVDDIGDVVTESAAAGSDTVQSSISYTLSANVENLLLTGTGTRNGVGNSLNNVLTGNSGNNKLDGGAGIDTMIGGLGNDTYVVDVAGETITENAGEGTDTVQSVVSYTLGANLENLTLLGTGTRNGVGNGLNNVLTGNSGKNSLSGGDGNDTLIGGAGIDTMIGGKGNDTYSVDNSADVVTEAVSAGTDTVQSSLSYTLGANLENLMLTGSAAINGTGNALANVITGNDGDNLLNGSTGADTMIGGVGSDTYIVDDIHDVVIEQPEAGAVTRVSTTSSGGQANDYSQNPVFAPDGSAVMFTSKASNLVTGDSNAVTDIFIKNLSSGAVTCISASSAGVLGNSSSHEAVFSPDGKYVAFESDASNLVAGDNNVSTDIFLKNLQTGLVTLLSSDSSGVIGNASSSNPVFSPDGSKVMFSSGSSNLVAGDSNGAQDIFIKDLATGVVTRVSSSSSGVQGDGRSDYAVFSPDGTKVAFSSYANNLVTGDSGNNLSIFIKDLQTGTVTLVSTSSAGAQLGSDNNGAVFSPDGSKLLFSAFTPAPDGLSTIDQGIFIKDLTSGVLTRISTDSLGTAGNGNFYYKAFFSPDGSKVMFSSTSSNLVAGDSNASYDVYIKDLATGAVTLASQDRQGVLGGGNSYAGAFSPDGTRILIQSDAPNLVSGDTNGANDIFIKTLPLASIDTVQSSVSYTLSANVENLQLTGSAALNGTGNAQNNVLTGNSAANTLSGLAGSDTMVGGLGDDTYLVDNSGDVVTENAAAGTDTVQSSISYRLGDNVENLVLTGIGTRNGIGNSLNNVLTGNSGNNKLDGGAGIDTMIGGLGNDTYVVDVAGETITEAAGGGVDTVQSAVSYTLGANLENLTLLGTGTRNGVGNSLANVLTGNSGNNSLTGGLGNDTYSLSRTSAHDTFIDNDSTAGNNDQLLFASDVHYDQLWFKQVGNDLEVDIIGTSNSALIKNWYLGAANHIETLKSGDGKTLTDSHVQNLVNAMASMTEPGTGQTTLTPSQQTTLAPVFAANWT